MQFGGPSAGLRIYCFNCANNSHVKVKGKGHPRTGHEGLEE
jgi:hypothetical protein